MEFENETPVVDLSFLTDEECAKAFNESDEISPSGIPHGTYEAVILSVDIQNSKNSGNPMLVWQLQVCDGSYAGRFLPSHYSMLPIIIKKEDGSKDHERSDDLQTQKDKFGRVRGELAEWCQVSVPDLKSLPDVIRKAAETVVEVKIVPQKDSEYSRSKIQKYLGRGTSAEMGGAETGGADIPF